MDSTALHSEITTDPAHLGFEAFVSSGNDLAVVALLNTPGNLLTPPQSWTKTVVVYRFALLKWAASGPRAALAAAAANSQSPVQAIAQVALDMLAGAVEYLDITDPQIGGPSGMVAALVAAGVVTSAQQTALTALGSAPASRAEVLFGAGMVVTQADVSQALRGQA